MKRCIALLLFILFMVAGPANAMIFRTPEEIAEEFFRAWRMQNQTYMENRMISGGGLTSFGKLMSRQYLLDYTVDWTDTYRGLTIMKIKTKMKSVEYGLKTLNFYFYFMKVNGSWELLNGIHIENEYNTKEAYNIFMWANSL